MSTGKRSKDDGKTKMYKVVKEDTKKKKTKPKTKEDYVKESEVNKKNKKGKKKGKHPKLKKALIIIFIIFILLCLIGVGVFAGVFFSDKLKLTKEELTIGHKKKNYYIFRNGTIFTKCLCCN